ncbi:DDB1- and CUL4-associated factor homolog 1-like isoform X2 [Phragmites australis]|uniref:DDB1- and CUL4-associated factor homolog 1-like isoform X2 n=1 Tax=Phragmites australis TaxID=29695 RepID=UPI002D798782|nr:DDB1- and CUL4-associated factor homolog 1-like isoform X2 [Phragmites australis]
MAATEPGSAPPHEDDEALLARVHSVISRVLHRDQDPNPRLLHTLATICELHEARYLQLCATNPMLNNTNTRGTYTIGKLANLLRDNDDFYELVFCKFLSDKSYSVAVRAAAARLLLSCHSAWMPQYPHAFEDSIIENIKSWVTEDAGASNECEWKYLRRNKPTDAEMLRTYAIGLLAMALCSGGQLVEDVLTVGVSAKLMHFLRIRVLVDASSSQKDSNHPLDTKHPRGRDDGRGKSRLAQDGARLDGTKVGYGMLTDPTVEKDNEPCVGMRQAHGEKGVDDTISHADASFDNFDIPEADRTNDRSYSSSIYDTKSKYGERPSVMRLVKDEDISENGELLKRKLSRAPARLRVKGKAGESLPECEVTPLSPTSGLRIGGQATRHRNVVMVGDQKKATDANSSSAGLESFSAISREEYEDRFRDCIIGLNDISGIVLKAVRAAEAEARSANAPDEALKAAGDAAAELVKSAALEVWKSENNGDAAVLAADKAAATVVEAAMSTSVSRSSNQVSEECAVEEAVQTSEDQELEDFVISDHEQLLQVREKYSIQCLQVLGEYVEALGPVLHEKGVDVCLSLLQRSIKDQEGCGHFALLPDVLKLICALAAHRKFAALFVDRGGIQKILSVPRITQTYTGLSACLFTFGSLQSTMERVCALSSYTLDNVVELALQLLECPQDLARKSAAIFFAAAFVFKAVLDLFDARDGMQKLLDILYGCASVRSGGNSGGLGSSNVSQGNDRSPAEGLTASEKQVAYHTCVALRQYFRAHLLQLVDSIRPGKSIRSIARNTSSARAGYKPFDISNEAMDAVFRQIQRDRKLGPAFVKARWPALDKFLASSGHITMLELCKFQAHGDRYLRDLTQYAIGVLHIVTLMPYSRKWIVHATLSNNRVGMAVLLDAVKSFDYIDHEVICPALNVLVNLVCPPPAISNKPSSTANQQPTATQAFVGTSESRDRNFEKSTSDRNLIGNQGESRDRSGDGNPVERTNTSHQGNTTQISTPVVPSGVVGDRRISLGVGAGGPGLAAQLEQAYRQAREVVRANNGIKILLQLLSSRMVTHPVAIDSIRALACRVLLGLARDDAIAHILTKLQVGKKLSELIRDTSAQTSGGDSGRWQTELTQVAIELIGVLTNSGKETTLAATDAAAPALRRIERAGIAAATPISYHSRELMQLIHEHLLGSGFTATAAMLQKEAGLAPLPLIAAVLPVHQVPALEASSVQQQWPSGRVQGFLPHKTNITTDQAGQRSDSVLPSSKKKALTFSSSFSQRTQSPHPLSGNRASNTPKSPVPIVADAGDAEILHKTPLSLPLKRKLVDMKDLNSASVAKRPATTDQSCQSSVFQTPAPTRRGLSVVVDSPTAFHSGRTNFNNISAENLDNSQGTPGVVATTAYPGVNDQQSGNLEPMTLDSMVVQYLKHQHRQCPAPITTLPPLSLLHPHVCPELSRSLSAPANIAARMGSREISRQFSGIQVPRRDRHFIYSRFKQCRVCRDEASLLTCMTFLGDASRVAAGNHNGELRIFDCNTANLLDTQTCHQLRVTMMESTYSGGNELILTSSLNEVKIWDASSISGGPLHTFEGCKAARFSHSGTLFAALSTDATQREVQLYDVQTYNLDLRLPDNSSNSGSGRGYIQPIIHFSPSDTMLLWNGVLWDRRSPNPVHQFDQFTDYCGGGFHPAGNEVILNSEVWDLRKFKLLRSVPSLDQTVIKFNGTGDVIYAILRRNRDDLQSSINARRVRHPLFPAFRTIDAVTYSDIATVQLDRCVLDLATEPNDSLIGVVAMDDHEEMFSSARLFEVGRKRITDDDSDPEDAGDTEDEDDDNDDSDDDMMLAPVLEGETDSDDLSNSSNDGDNDEIASSDENDDDPEFIDEGDLEGGGLLEIMGDGEGDGDESDMMGSFSSEDEGWIM